MRDTSATTPSERRRLLVRAIVESRRTGATLRLEAGDTRIEYEGQRVRLVCSPDERDRLDALLDEYHVFKIKQPETRKADEGVVYLSAVTDPKHAADFLDELFDVVYDVGDGYALSVTVDADD